MGARRLIRVELVCDGRLLEKLAPEEVVRVGQDVEHEGRRYVFSHSSLELDMERYVSYYEPVEEDE